MEYQSPTLSANYIMNVRVRDTRELDACKRCLPISDSIRTTLTQAKKVVVEDMGTRQKRDDGELQRNQIASVGHR